VWITPGLAGRLLACLGYILAYHDAAPSLARATTGSSRRVAEVD
jgi:hypothetical protein